MPNLLGLLLTLITLLACGLAQATPEPAARLPGAALAVLAQIGAIACFLAGSSADDGA